MFWIAAALVLGALVVVIVRSWRWSEDVVERNEEAIER